MLCCFCCPSPFTPLSCVCIHCTRLISTSGRLWYFVCGRGGGVFGGRWGARFFCVIVAQGGGWLNFYMNILLRNIYTSCTVVCVCVRMYTCVCVYIHTCVGICVYVILCFYIYKRKGRRRRWDDVAEDERRCDGAARRGWRPSRNACNALQKRRIPRVRAVVLVTHFEIWKFWGFEFL